MGPDDPAHAGQRHYTTAFLRIYDPLVLGLYCRWIWRCPSRELLTRYRRLVGRRHLDVGPGTGWFLQRAQLPPGSAITLMDPNPEVLRHASARLAHLQPSTLDRDVLTPSPDIGPFDSVALANVLHCLPGPMRRRAPAIANLAAVLEGDGVLFGATVLGTPRLHTPLSRWAMAYNNREGIFDNGSDTEDGLRDILSASFDDVAVDVRGAVGLFTARRPSG